ncbi:hypothetical protein BEI02_15715 [Elizabethkingia sp. HvH-WGS333]|uniref:Putative Co/Zn/Cd efflux system membrane fusion protein n=2 Tax=Elizabethkingia anophelis TaxID=1117645 RepID=A0A455ZIN7_9FLAO|nr:MULTISPECIES: DUF3347 domain-containing protein [Elizabethkingia]AIL45292.1 putative Co/Zn/Cd efflux system membrane fusion protein [Elizabethkingia anophelis NUHP1]MCL1641496.1 DUF3347 domain-containing protein [Elizabethkingia anophelis]MCL1646307.1 DUF3347 domain-containing protein [Elizabethkingia anophelis]OIK46331.1 hypothetical protein BEI02_15715 [Elizabethkingia sp. HvH-WGS333]DAC75887.1 TPA_exp: putative Co/Zn/Cd efflux system membrane fusion protein [Elizabethkingia anophelis]
MKHLILGIFAISPNTLTGYSNSSEKKSEDADHTSDSSMEPSAAIGKTSILKNTDFGGLFSHYQHLASALSTDDNKGAANVANGILEALSKIETSNFNTEQRKTYNDIASNIKENAKHIANNGGSIAYQREHFATLSQDFYDIAKSFGTETPVYKVDRPMFDNKKGAIWLSSHKEVKNPYYGKAMAACGEIQEKLK